jgi:aconitate hydratase
MNPDIEKIKTYYRQLPEKIRSIKEILDRPLSLAEKILYSHLSQEKIISFARGVDYVDFSPDRVAMQDATAQMALLQFLVTGKQTSYVPASVHCDHLIIARNGADDDLF